MTKYWLGAIACAIVGILAFKTVGAGAMVVAAPFAWFVSRIIVKSGADMFAWLSRQPLKEWEGCYYAFDNQHIRAYDIDGDPWVVEDDLLALVEQRKSRVVELFSASERAAVPGLRVHALSHAGCVRLLGKSPHPLAGRVLLYLEREIFDLHRKRKERATRLNRPEEDTTPATAVNPQHVD